MDRGQFNVEQKRKHRVAFPGFHFLTHLHVKKNASLHFSVINLHVDMSTANLKEQANKKKQGQSFIMNSVKQMVQQLSLGALAIHQSQPVHATKRQ